MREGFIGIEGKFAAASVVDHQESLSRRARGHRGPSYGTK
jgi:hypothetical protein